MSSFGIVATVVVAGTIILMLLQVIASQSIEIREKDDIIKTLTADSEIGLRVFTDESTGRQYLVAENGSMTPRIGPDGKQFCVKGKYYG